MADHLRFLPPAYPGGRLPLFCGSVAVGAVFPPAGDPPGKWAWRVWVTAQLYASEGQSTTEAKAKAAAIAAFRVFLDAARLVPMVEGTDA